MADSSVTFFHIAENDDDLTHDETETITALVAVNMQHNYVVCQHTTALCSHET